MASHQASPSSTYSLQIGPQAQLTYGNGGVSSQPRQVFVTPLATAIPTASKFQSALISKMLIKAVTKDGKKGDGKTFTLRNIDTSTVKSSGQLVSLIKTQLQGDIRSDFEVGYIDNNSVVTIRSPEDVNEVFSSVAKGSKVTLWCDGLRSTSAGSKGKKRPHPRHRVSDSCDESDEETSKQKKKSKEEEKDDKIQKTIDDLKAKHGESFTPMQYRIWAEMTVSGLHKSYDSAPTNPIFLRAGGDYPRKKLPSGNDTLTQAITAIASAISPRPSPVPASSIQSFGSPSKVIEGRSNYDGFRTFDER